MYVKILNLSYKYYKFITKEKIFSNFKFLFKFNKNYKSNIKILLL